MITDKLFALFYKVVVYIGQRFGKLFTGIDERLVTETDGSEGCKKLSLLDKMDGYDGIFSPIVENIFSPKVVFPLVFFLYVFAGAISQVPYLFWNHYFTGLLILAGVLIAYLIGVELSERVEVVNDREEKYLVSEGWADFCYGLIVIGTSFWLFHYLRMGGIPLLNPGYRGRSIAWMIGFVLFTFGTVLTTGQWTKMLEKKMIQGKQYFLRIFLLILFILMIAVPNVYRIDIIVPVLSVLIVVGMRGHINQTKTVLVVLVIILLTLGQRVLHTLLSSGVGTDVSYLTFSRAGFTLYSFGRIVRVSGLTGFTGGSFYISTIYDILLAILNIPRARGEMIASEVIGSPGALTTTFAGPFVMDFGILAPLIPALLLGLVLGLGYRIVKSDKYNDKLSVPLYALMLTISLIWIESGPVRFYLMIIFGIGALYFLTRSKFT